jgi:hypothetical protein
VVAEYRRANALIRPSAGASSRVWATLYTEVEKVGGQLTGPVIADSRACLLMMLWCCYSRRGSGNGLVNFYASASKSPGAASEVPAVEGSRAYVECAV